MTLQPAQGGGIGHAVSFDHVAQNSNIHVGAKETGAVARRHSLRFRKSALGEVNTKMFVERRATGLRQVGPWRFWLCPAMTQRLPETERMHRHFHGPTTHA